MNLKLPLHQSITKAQAHRLALAFGAKTALTNIPPTDNTASTPPIDTPKPRPPPNPFAPLIANGLDIEVGTAVVANHCLDVKTSGKPIGNDTIIKHKPIKALRSCQTLTNTAFIPISHCTKGLSKPTYLLSHDINGDVIPFDRLANCVHGKSSNLFGLYRHGNVFGSGIKRLLTCQRAIVNPTTTYQTALSYGVQSTLLGNGLDITQIIGIDIPCRYYPLPPKPPPPPPIIGRVCKVRPPSNRLPLTLKKRHHSHQHIKSSNLPLIIGCWHDDIIQTTPNLGAYIVLNTIRATLDDVVIEPLSFNIKTDIHSYCWQGEIGIGHSDYQKIKGKLNAKTKTPPQTPPIVRVVINGTAFAFMAENVAHHRSFVNFSHSLSGRSTTALLGADFAHAQNGLIDQDSYASQLINSQLAGLPFKCQFKTDDWLIPKGQLSVTGKTPIAVIDEIANACGAFVSSDKDGHNLMVAPKYKTPVWQMDKARADRIVPLDVIKSISEQQRNHPPFNTVTIVSNVQGGIVYRQELAQDNPAPVFHSPLACDQTAIINKGKQILSDGGRHIDVSITMRWADKYNIALANLGELWQINDTDGAWLGVVVSVAIDVKLEDGVPCVWQVVGVDRWVG